MYVHVIFYSLVEYFKRLRFYFKTYVNKNCFFIDFSLNLILYSLRVQFDVKSKYLDIPVLKPPTIINNYY